MIEVDLSENAAVRVDVCRSCHFVWFDIGETETLIPKPPQPAKKELPQKVRETMALLEVERLAREAEREDAAEQGRLWGSILSAINFW